MKLLPVLELGCCFNPDPESIIAFLGNGGCDLPIYTSRGKDFEFKQRLDG